MYSIISHTLLHDGQNLLIGDPAVCEFYDRLISIEETNKNFLRLSKLPAGGYYAYHRSSDDASVFVKDLLFVHDSVRPEDDFCEKELGLVCVALSNSIFICEENKAFDARFSYFALEGEALYDTSEILKILNVEGVLMPAEKDLAELCSMHSLNGYVTGKEILSIVGTGMVPAFLRTVPSTHWSADIARRLALVPAASIIGGVVSNVYSEFVRAYALFKDDLLIGIRICLETV